MIKYISKNSKKNSDDCNMLTYRFKSAPKRVTKAAISCSFFLCIYMLSFSYEYLIP